MFLHLGGCVVVPKKDVVLILDHRMKKLPVTSNFMKMVKGEGSFYPMTKEGKVKSYVVTEKEVFESPISSTTLKRRYESPVQM